MKKLMPAHYSGGKSEPFWSRVGALKDPADHGALYALGCALQNLEGYVLQQLANAEAQADAARVPGPAPGWRRKANGDIVRVKTKKKSA